MHYSTRLYRIVAFSLLFSALLPQSLFAGPSVTPTSLNFGQVTLGTVSSNSLAAPTITVFNNGHQSISLVQMLVSSSAFTVSGPSLPRTLSRGSRATFSVAFVPTAAGSYNGTISFTTTGHGATTLTVSVSGTAANAPPAQTYLLSPSATSLAFGKVLVGTSLSQTLSLSNTGNSSVNVSAVSLSGSSFSASGFSGPVTLAAGQALSFSVACSPSYTGSYTGSITVTSNATNSPASISLSGTGVQPAISVVPASVSFTSDTVGVTNSQTVTISNPGTANLTISQAALVGSGFTYSGLALPLTIVPGASSPFTVSFTPMSASTFSASLTLSNNAPTSSMAVPLSGTGTAPVLTLSSSPTSLTFPSTTTGSSSAAQVVTLTNTGNSAVSISQVTPSSNFTVSGVSLPLSLAANQTTSFNVLFAPTTTGSLSGTVTVTSTASNSPTTIKLSGSGASAAVPAVNLSWTPSSSSYTGFDIYRGSVSGGPYTMINSSLTPAFTDNTVAASQTYYYVVTEIDSSGNQSNYSNQATAVVP
jgi:HYDIN/CFA65/VesB-like, Ig-like domain/Cep192 domain 4/Transmembrane protein 131-like N-terminal